MSATAVVRVVTDVTRTLRIATPSALLGGAVWLGLTFLQGAEPNWLQGALFMLAFGVVATLGYHYSGES
jgi:hypothetical protein